MCTIATASVRVIRNLPSDFLSHLGEYIAPAWVGGSGILCPAKGKQTVRSVLYRAREERCDSKCRAREEEVIWRSPKSQDKFKMLLVE